MFGLDKSQLNKRELKMLLKLKTPRHIQDFLDSLPMNFEEEGETYMSPRMVLRLNRAHCIEGALLAALALWVHGEEPLLMDLRTNVRDVDHVVALYRINNLWGAISKTNHATVRWRDPVYRSLRELAMSYFHEYFLDNNGEKTLLSYSSAFNLKRLNPSWMTTEGSLYYIAKAIDDCRHFDLYPGSQGRHIRRADPMERRAGALREWPDPEIYAKIDQ